MLIRLASGLHQRMIWSMAYQRFFNIEAAGIAAVIFSILLCGYLLYSLVS